MKDKCFIYYANPCTACLTESEVRTFEDAQKRGPRLCPLLAERDKCSAPRFGCVAVAGARMARSVLQFYTRASEENLALDREFFRRRALLPPEGVEAYIDTAEYGFRRITDPDLAVRRVWEYARAVLDLEEGEQVGRVAGGFAPPGEEVLDALVWARGGREREKKAAERAKGRAGPGLRHHPPEPRPA